MFPSTNFVLSSPVCLFGTLVSREAKSYQSSLKELLKSREPYDKDVDFQRKRLHLNLLLVHSKAQEAKTVENDLWMQTSYAFISAYKQHITKLDRAIQANQKQQPGQGPPHGKPNPHHGVVEHRKLVQRFKQFLAEEEKFWTQLVLRLLRLFDLREARPAVVALGLLSDSEGVVNADATATADHGDGADRPMHGANGRNHFQFPPEGASSNLVPSSVEEREARLATLSKALICLGDIARYREQYNESNGRPRAGHDDLVPARRGKSKRGGGPEPFIRPRNYDKAQACYEQARQLVPYEGNPSHQLAILASYKKDTFASIAHYYRSLCVRQPFDTAAENLGTVLSKALDGWRLRLKRERDPSALDPTSPSQPVHIRVEVFRDQVVVLHALWRVGLDKDIDKMRAILPKHNDKVAKSFYTLVSQRHLPDNMILSTIVLSQGALWKHKIIRDTQSSHPSRQNDLSSAPLGTDVQIEWAIVDHLLDLYFSLLEVGKDELKDPPHTDVSGDLAQIISATFRRTLTALRIASKWLRANFKYLARDREFLAFQKAEKLRGVEILKTEPTKMSGYSTKTIRFWKAYAAFMLLLSQAFPDDNLPVFDGPLEEDLEVRGFLPLQGYMTESKKAGVNGVAEQVHPNVEHLMRISDLLADAKSLAELEHSPIQLINGHFVFRLDAVEEIRPLTHPEIPVGSVLNDPIVPGPQQRLMTTIRDLQPKQDQDVDAMTEITNRTDDDPVRDAFKHVLDSPEGSVDEEFEEFEEDEIVYMRSNTSPTLSPKDFTTPATPVKPLSSPKNISPRSPTLFSAVKVPFSVPSTTTPAIPTTTAQDLLNNVLGNNRRRGSLNHHIESTPPQSTFGHSIWSTSLDEHTLRYNTTAPNGIGARPGHHLSPNGMNDPVSKSPHLNAMYANNARHSSDVDLQNVPRVVSGQIYQSTHSFHPSQDVSLSQHSNWSSSLGSTQNSHQNMVGVMPSALFAQQPHFGLGLGHGLPAPGLNSYHHDRIPPGSNSLPPTQLYTNLAIGHVQSDPFTYISPDLQPPPMRPSEYPVSRGYFNAGPMHAPSGETVSIGRSLIGGSIGPGQPYYTSPGPGQHSRHISVGDEYFVRPNPLAYGNTG
ncbi:hypothetical protein CPB83DRAFT_898487 [Crepidotus variabilis]|uniref:Protein SMG7 n=1 Tax=Crepidotus variabilis TaxID=179855 RepID=A0A9P6E7C0_9AGAR|nr:hypothetical protein CPB83DRAFT_898487 [Crepidotus variabilis]